MLVEIYVEQLILWGQLIKLFTSMQHVVLKNNTSWMPNMLIIQTFLQLFFKVSYTWRHWQKRKCLEGDDGHGSGSQRRHFSTFKVSWLLHVAGCWLWPTTLYFMYITSTASREFIVVRCYTIMLILISKTEHTFCYGKVHVGFSWCQLGIRLCLIWIKPTSFFSTWPTECALYIVQ